MTRLALPPLSLYVHLPWCVRKCPYCDFNSHALPAAGLPESAYLAALLHDLEFAARDVPGRGLVSVFFGGGTPSLFSPAAVGRVLASAMALLPLAGDVEVTLEANPGTVEHGAFAAYRDAGVNRVSLGAQSFDDRCLAALGRIHGRGEIVAAAVELRAAGIENFNLDLMYGLPGQDLAGAIDDVVRALDLGPTHLSHYQLTLEPGTVFARRPPALPDEDLVLDMQHACAEQIAAAGFEQYEVSAHARPGRRCRHNLNYWSFGDYLGIGAGAHGKVTDPGCERVIRTERVRSPVQFLSASAPGRRVASRRAVDPGELPFEFLLNALRLLDGFDESLFEGRTGQPWAAVAGTAREQEALGLLERTGVGRWAATDRGRLFLNDLQAAFLPGPMHGCASHLGPG